MPLNETGQKTLADFKKRYGDKQGERYFYATENKRKKFRDAMTGKEKSSWWQARLQRLPVSVKARLEKVLVGEQD